MEYSSCLLQGYSSIDILSHLFVISWELWEGQDNVVAKSKDLDLDLGWYTHTTVMMWFGAGLLSLSVLVSSLITWENNYI